MPQSSRGENNTNLAVKPSKKADLQPRISGRAAGPGKEATQFEDNLYAINNEQRKKERSVTFNLPNGNPENRKEDAAAHGIIHSEEDRQAFDESKKKAVASPRERAATFDMKQ